MRYFQVDFRDLELLALFSSAYRSGQTPAPWLLIPAVGHYLVSPQNWIVRVGPARNEGKTLRELPFAQSLFFVF